MNFFIKKITELLLISYCTAYTVLDRSSRKSILSHRKHQARGTGLYVSYSCCFIILSISCT